MNEESRYLYLAHKFFNASVCGCCTLIEIVFFRNYKISIHCNKILKWALNSDPQYKNLRKRTVTILILIKYREKFITNHFFSCSVKTLNVSYFYLTKDFVNDARQCRIRSMAVWSPVVSIILNRKSHSVTTELCRFIKNLQKLKQQIQNYYQKLIFIENIID